MAGGVLLVARIMHMVGEAATVPTMTGARSGIPTEAGEAPPVVGVIHNQSQTGLAPSYLGRGLFFGVGSQDQEKIPNPIPRIALSVSGVLWVGLPVTIISFAGVALA